MAKAPKQSKVRISMWLPADLHERLRAASEVDHRTLASFTIVALKRALDEFEAAHAKKK